MTFNATPVTGPSLWTREDLVRATDWIRPLDAAVLEDIDRGV